MKRAITELKYITCIDANNINRKFREYASFQEGLKYRAIAETDNGVTIVTNSGIISVGKYRFAEYQSKKIKLDSLLKTKSVIYIRNIQEAKELNKYLSFQTGRSFTDVFLKGEMCITLEYGKYSVVYATRSYYSDTHKIYTMDQIDFEEFILPEKWALRPISEEEKLSLNKFIHTKLTDYIGYRATWDAGAHCWLHFPQYTARAHSDSVVNAGYTEITFQQFEKYVLKQDIVKARELELPEIKLLGETLEFIKGSVQFANKTLNKADLEAINRVLNLCEEQEISLSINNMGKSLITLRDLEQSKSHKFNIKYLNDILKRLK